MATYWRITLRVNRDAVPGELRIRRLLKEVLRWLALECVNVEHVETRGQLLPAPDSEPWPKFRKDSPCTPDADDPH